jgi:hypothetical protein
MPLFLAPSVHCLMLMSKTVSSCAARIEKCTEIVIEWLFVVERLLFVLTHLRQEEMGLSQLLLDGSDNQRSIPLESSASTHPRLDA